MSSSHSPPQLFHPRGILLLAISATAIVLAVLATRRDANAPVAASKSALENVAKILPQQIDSMPAAADAPTEGSAAGAPPKTLTGEAAMEQLRKSGQYESLGAALQAARYAAEQIDPAGPHSRGAEFFAANPGQQLRAWFGRDGIELASGRAPAKEAADAEAEPWSVAVRLRAAGREG